MNNQMPPSLGGMQNSQPNQQQLNMLSQGGGHHHNLAPHHQMGPPSNTHQLNTPNAAAVNLPPHMQASSHSIQQYDPTAQIQGVGGAPHHGPQMQTTGQYGGMNVLQGH